MKIVKYIMTVVLLTFISAGITANAADKAKKDPMQFARGAKAWSQRCESCHNLRGPKEFSDSDWDTIVTHMRVRANLPGDVARDIVAFLKASNNEKVK